MKTWIVDVTAEIPYPWLRSFSIEKSSPGAAVSAALKQYRTAVRAKLGKSKKMTAFKINVRAVQEEKGVSW